MLATMILSTGSQATTTNCKHVAKAIQPVVRKFLSKGIHVSESIVI